MATRLIKPLADFEAEIAALNMRGQWQYDASASALGDGPKPAGIPHIWKWDAVLPKLLEAGSVIPAGSTERRALGLTNPGLHPRTGTTQTIVMSLQMVMPHEVAWAHRHSMAAVRFTIDGNKELFTAADGQRFVMEPNDLILTPAWSWHDHHNESDRAGIWLDVLDVPLVFALNQGFYEDYGEISQQLFQPGEAPYERGAIVRPAWEYRRTVNVPFRYRWKDVREQLYAFAKDGASPYDGVILEYVNPMTGSSTLPTLACYVQLLPGGFATAQHRHTSSTIYHVIQGRGTTYCGEIEMNWGERDSFVVPNWMKHRHVNNAPEDAILFSVTDEPVLAALGLYREDPARAEYWKPAPTVPGTPSSKA